jgi:signal transduction histidine kinase
MTHRITLAILVTVWAILLASAVVAYLTTRAVLLASLDQSLIGRAASLPEIVDENGHSLSPVSSLRADDRYIVRNEIGQTFGRPTTGTTIHAAPQLLHASFAPLPRGGRVRTVTLRALGKPAQGGPPVPVTVTFSGSAGDFDRLLSHLGWSLCAVGAAGALLSATVARVVAKRCLRPLHAAAEVVGTIDERTLDRRIEQQNLPPELVPVADRINHMLERLEEALRRRRQFAADASHELRTPVAALVTAIEVALRRERDPSQYRQTLFTCLADARLLQRLVEALLVQVKSELSAFQQPLQNIDAAILIDECARAISPLAELQEIQLHVNAPSPLPIHTQPDRLRSIVMNLVGNAVQHNRSGGRVEVSASVDDGILRLEVRDTGLGIAQEHLAHLFEPFYRADAARGGSDHLGLGLYLVRTHVQALGGSCRVASELGRGATFEVKLPGANEAPIEPAAVTAEYVK